jgi:hypothetical protein
VIRDYQLDEHHVHVLTAASEALDRAHEARERLASDGAYVEGRYGLRAHPAVSVERDSRLAFLRALRELDLDAEAAPDARPPRR